jgi:hypothetical protein
MGNGVPQFGHEPRERGDVAFLGRSDSHRLPHPGFQ